MAQLFESLAMQKWQISEDAWADGIAEARWPGRLEQIVSGVWLDAAHNPDGARALAAAIPQVCGGPVTLVLGVLADKDARAIARELVRSAARIITTTPPSPRALSARDLAAAAGEVALSSDIVPVDDPRQAIDRARASGHPVVIAGSLFLVALARQHLTGEPADEIATFERL